MKKYEIMYIVRPTLDETAIKNLIGEMNNIFPNYESKVVKTNEWGMKELAYEIQKHTRGFYVVLNVEATPAAIAEFDRVAGIKEDIIRYMIVAE